MTSSQADRRTPLLSVEKAAEVRERFGTPCYVYDRATLETTTRRALAFPAPYGFTLRYAMILLTYATHTAVWMECLRGECAERLIPIASDAQ